MPKIGCVTSAITKLCAKRRRNRGILISVQISPVTVIGRPEAETRDKCDELIDKLRFLITELGKIETAEPVSIKKAREGKFLITPVTNKHVPR